MNIEEIRKELSKISNDNECKKVIELLVKQIEEEDENRN